MKCVQVLLHAPIINRDDAIAVENCKKSIMSFNHCVKVDLDTARCTDAKAWNRFFDKWRYHNYDYLLLVDSSSQIDPVYIDYLTQGLEFDPNIGIISAGVTRDIDAFRAAFGQRDSVQGYLLPGDRSPINMIIRKGVIERVGGADEGLTGEMMRADFVRRCDLSGFWRVEVGDQLSYLPPLSGRIGRDQKDLHINLRRYLKKWGGDIGDERFEFPYDDPSLDYKFVGNYTKIIVKRKRK